MDIDIYIYIYIYRERERERERERGTYQRILALILKVNSVFVPLKIIVVTLLYLHKKKYVKNRFIGNPFFDDVVHQALSEATPASACRAAGRRHVHAISNSFFVDI
jgi:hypothetical protein